MSDFTKLIEQAQKLQANLKQSQDQLQSRLKDIEVVGEAGGGVIKIGMLANREPTWVKIDPNLSDDERAILEELLLAAFKDACRRAQKAAQEETSKIMSSHGLNTNQLMNMLGGDFSKDV